MVFFSIVIPIYDVASYLRECIDSVLTQDFDDFEIIGMDDCSPDHSGQILDEMAARDSRIKAIHLGENVGPGMARNAAIEVATGTYLLFLDSDDTLAPGSLSEIAACLGKADQPDVLIYDYSRVWWDGHVVRSWGDDGVLASLAGPPFKPQDHVSLFGLQPIACNKACKRSFIESIGLRFRSGYYEDVSFSYTVLLSAQTAITLDRVVLLYRQRRHGNMGRTTSPKHFDIFAQYGLVLDFAADQQIHDPLRKRIYDAMIVHVSAVLAHPERLAKADRRRFFAQASVYAIKYQPAKQPSVRENLPTNIRSALLRRNWYALFGAYSWLAKKQAPLRRLAGRGYWAMRRCMQIAGRGYYRLLRFQPMDPNLVVFTEYWGGGYGCNPRAVFEKMQEIAPNLKAVWIISPEKGGGIPAGVKQLAPSSLKIWSLFARATYFVNNVNFPSAYVKRPGQIHLQTMRGTPLKHTGIDVMNRVVTTKVINRAGTPRRRRGRGTASAEVASTHQDFVDLLHRADRWDYVLTSNAHSTEVWGRAYPCAYKTLEFGYPRNDRLTTATAQDIAQARANLGIRSDQTAVLYAPTYRDIEGDTSMRIDFKNLISKVSDEFVFIVRAHHTTHLTKELKDLAAAGRIIDGSTEPSIADLYLAADVLITDYSSAMFDYAILNRPIIIFADDWDAYQEARGTYFDLLETPPGAVARNQAELVDVFAQLTYQSARNRELLTRFRERFCEFDDGLAAERAVRFTMLHDATPPVSSRG